MSPVDAPSRWDEPLARVLGARSAVPLENHLGLRTVGDLLRHYPRRYYARGELTDLAHLVPGEHVTVSARVDSVSLRRIRAKLTKLDVVVTDGRARLNLTFFNQAWREKDLQVGRQVLVAGKVEVFARRLSLTNPEVLEDDEDDDLAARLLPVYPATAKVSSRVLAKAVRVVLDLVDDLEDPLPEPVRERQGVLPLAEAMRLVPRPRDRSDVRRAQNRLRWDEAFVLQAALARRRAERRSLPAQPRVPRPDGVLASFDSRLPFELTAGQRAVGQTLAADLARDHPMHRLLQGEVGSGKTLVALRAMLAVVDAGGQAALLAPTEVLAQQHHRGITAMLGPLAEGGLLGGSEQGTRVALLTGSQGAAARKKALLQAASGEAGIVVGTHALLQEHVQFADLGLVVVDEQHRFGVEQRDALRAKGERPPHLLVMTATPIPRTVAMTVFGDLETSALTELPRGRSPITTHVVPVAEKPRYLDRAWERIREEVRAGHRAYVVCPRIGDEPGPAEGGPGGRPPRESASADGARKQADAADDGERRPAAAVLEVAPLLADGPLADLRVEPLHGRMAPEAKDAVMRGFSTGEVDVLVATTVIEVGVDVPEATVMVVLDADRFGVSQLHQLRGRVGRGAAPGLALLVTEAPEGTPARERLDAVAATLDGFELSRVDLEQRREGDVLGASQSGRRSSLRMLSVLRDEDVIRAAREEATALVEADPDLARWPGLRAAVEALLDEERADYLDKG